MRPASAQVPERAVPAVGGAIEDIIALLGFLFAWDDLLATQRALEEMTQDMLQPAEGFGRRQRLVLQPAHRELDFIRWADAVVHNNDEGNTDKKRFQPRS
ncbi:hypothetical protein [Corallococcus silvisoli]|uniref:hypothetical protein n=1 Tax=Corallococcus silvisoli TaxID=2697031 RepID=UPI00137677EF|nr:hypothetical protein [Corallococcus silvisoli]NBD13810.1 hypothetical protein [Corallococcus silvisoli]